MHDFNTMTRSAPAFGQGATPRPIKLQPDPPASSLTLYEATAMILNDLAQALKPRINYSGITRDIARSTQAKLG